MNPQGTWYWGTVLMDVGENLDSHVNELPHKSVKLIYGVLITCSFTVCISCLIRNELPSLDICKAENIRSCSLGVEQHEKVMTGNHTVLHTLFYAKWTAGHKQETVLCLYIHVSIGRVGGRVREAFTRSS